MHSNKRGECCPRTLLDRKRKRYDNAVDVVVRLHDPTDPSTEGGAPLDTQVDLRDHSLAVCGAPLHHIPPRSYHSGA